MAKVLVAELFEALPPEHLPGRPDLETRRKTMNQAAGEASIQP